MKFKKPARTLSIRKRFMALTANEKVVSKELVLQFMKITHKLCNSRLSFRLKLHGFIIQHMLLIKYMQINLEPNVNLEILPDKKTSINDFTEDECWNFFETRKEDLVRLICMGLRLFEEMT